MDGMERRLSGKYFHLPEDTGAAAMASACTTAVFASGRHGMRVYTCLNGGLFCEVDVVTNRLCFSQRMGNIKQVWAHAVTSRGEVYVAGLDEHARGELWVYRPQAPSLTRLACLPDGVQAWSCTSDEDSNAYIGTYCEEGPAHIYKWDASSKTLHNLGELDAGSAYVRSLAYHKGALYAGLGTVGRVMKLCPKTGRAEDISEGMAQLLQKAPGDIKFAYDMAIAGNKLFVRLDAGQTDALLTWDIERSQWDDFVLDARKTGSGVLGFTQLAQDERYAYLVYQNGLHRIDLGTMQVEDCHIDYPFALRGACLMADSQGLKVFTLSREAQLVCLDVTAGQVNVLESVMPASRLHLHHLVKSNQGTLFASTYPGGPVLLEYDCRQKSCTQYPQGQAESMVPGEGNSLYLGIYPGAVIKQMDTVSGETQTLLDAGNLYGQDRPYAMHYHQGKLFIGTVPPNGRLGGALIIYDTTTGSHTCYPNFIEGQSIVGLAVRGHHLYGTTTIYGGLEAEPSADEPLMFIWDMVAEQMLVERPVRLHKQERLEAPIISGLCFDRDGRLWAAADGCLLQLDAQTLEVLNSKTVYPDVIRRGRWRPVHIRPDEDGLMYTDIGGRITVIDTHKPDWPHLSLTHEGNMDVMAIAQDEDGQPCIYYIENPSDTICRIRIDSGRHKEDGE